MAKIKTLPARLLFKSAYGIQPPIDRDCIQEFKEWLDR